MAMRNRHNAAQSIFMDSAKGLANTLAAGAAFFGTPIIYTQTVDFVARFARVNYGEGFDDFASFVWFIAVACFVFFGARMSISTALVSASLAFAVRVL